MEYNTEDNHETPLYKSTYSANDSGYYSGNGAAPASSSKAVLAALRALQDKIRRLESERSAAIDETVQLRHQLKNLEIESEHVKQREILSSQKTLHEARNAYEKLLNEKSELEIRLSKLEEKNESNKNTMDELYMKVKSLEDEKRTGLERIKVLENEHDILNNTIHDAQQKEKELARTMVWETKRHEDEIDALKQQLRILQDEAVVVTTAKKTNETKCKELDQVVTQLLSVNEALVSKITGQEIHPTKQSIKKNTLNKKKGTVFVPRVASVVTNNMVAGRAVKYDQRNLSSSFDNTNDNANSAEQLKKLNKMYAKLAHTINDEGKKKKITKKVSLKTVDDNEINTSINTANNKVVTRLSLKKKNDNIAPSNSVRIPTPSSSLDFDNYYSSQPNNMRYNNNSSGSDLKDVISSLEEEFDALNSQYRKLLSSSTIDSETEQADELVNVIQKLHKKGEQLRSLKSPQKL
jgi:chromosome segregation ATPase